MANENHNERSSGADESLNGLPEKQREETKQILDELEAEALKRENENGQKPEGKKEEKPPETKVDDGKKPDNSDGKKPEETEKKESRREVKLVPAWMLERAKAGFEKRERELLDEIEKVSKGVISREEGKNEEKKPPEDLSKLAESIAEKHGITVELATDLLTATTKHGGELPEDVKADFAAVKTWRQEQEIAAELVKFNADFDSIVLPLVKAEYGDDVPPAIISDIREKLKELAYTPEFAKVPFNTLYKGEDQFRGVIPPKKKGAENAHGGSSSDAGGEGEGRLDLSKPLSDSEIRSLSNADFDIYMKNMETFERNNK